MKRIRGLIAVLMLSTVVVSLGEATLAKTSLPKKPNPFTGNLNVIGGGQRFFIRLAALDAHGVNGHGGVGSPLIDKQWKYGDDDQTLFEFITGQIGESRMPSFGEALEEDQAWKILAEVRSLYQGKSHTKAW
jgi:hypothetical protein